MDRNIAWTSQEMNRVKFMWSSVLNGRKGGCAENVSAECLDELLGLEYEIYGYEKTG